MRRDNRKADELREIGVIYEGLDRVDGSATFRFGDTQSLASISGPIEVRPNSELPSQATLEVHIRPLASIPGTDSKALAAALKTIFSPILLLSQHPRTLVQIVGQALCGVDSGSGFGSVGRGWHSSLVASLVNATSAALISASSVPMKGIVCAVAIGRLLDSQDPPVSTLVVDPSEAEVPFLAGGGCFAFSFSSTLSRMPSQENGIPPIALLWTNYTATTASFNDEEFEDARRLAEASAIQVWLKLKESLQSSRPPQPAIVEPSSGGKADMSDVDDEKMEI